MASTAGLYEKLQQQSGETERVTRLLHLLNRIGTVTPTMTSLERILHVHLTGITSNDGLRFNRASLFQLEHDERTLTGVMAIGQLDERMAHSIWEEMVAGSSTIDLYLQNMQAGAPIEWTELHNRIQGKRIEIPDDPSNALYRVLQSKSPLIVHASSESSLPPNFVAMSETNTSVVVIPLLVGNRLLGMLICDNKFTQEKLTNLDLLLHFAARMAAMMENDRLNREARESASVAGWQQGAYDERQQLHDKLHDIVGELQTRVRWDIEEATEHVENGHREQAKEDLEDGLAILDQITGPLKGVVEDLRPTILAGGDILDALRSRAPRLHPGQVSVDGQLRTVLPQKIRNELYWAGKEGLTNAAKYSGAKSDPQIHIALWLEQLDDQSVQLSITDNGVGFDPKLLNENGRYGGLSRLKQRVERAGGQCFIQSKVGTGTQLFVVFSLSQQGAETE